MDKAGRIYVAGHTGLAGSAILRRLQTEGCSNLITRSHAELDLAEQSATRQFFDAERPEYVFLAAARVGGIMANVRAPAEFILQNLQIQTNVFEASLRSGVKKLLFLGSSCIYPKLAPQPMTEEHLLTSALEPTNEPYAIAKIAGIKMAQAFRRQFGFNAISLMPTNLYGPGDNFDTETSHVLAALIRKFSDARREGRPQVVLWGSGTPRREFLHADDLASAAVFLMQRYDSAEIINVGVGEDHSIRELAEMVSSIVGYSGEAVFDHTRPDGAPRKLLDVSRLRALGWQPAISLRDGIAQTWAWYENHVAPSAAVPRPPAGAGSSRVRSTV
jgi:GDP-L-fucose synthase